jgi:hypothetical protein
LVLPGPLRLVDAHHLGRRSLPNGRRYCRGGARCHVPAVLPVPDTLRHRASTDSAIDQCETPRKCGKGAPVEGSAIRTCWWGCVRRAVASTSSFGGGLSTTWPYGCTVKVRCPWVTNKTADYLLDQPERSGWVERPESDRRSRPVRLTDRTQQAIPIATRPWRRLRPMAGLSRPPAQGAARRPHRAIAGPYADH